MVTEIKELLDLIRRSLTSRDDLVRRLEELERTAPAGLSCAKAVAWARFGQTTMLIEQLESVAGEAAGIVKS